jgi:hypothetical protein
MEHDRFDWLPALSLSMWEEAPNDGEELERVM